MLASLLALATPMHAVPARAAEYGLSDLERRIGGCESSGRPYGPLRWHILNDHHRSSSSGAFQIVKGTWARFKGYSEARFAPPEVQILRMRQLLHSRKGAGHWRASRGCWS